MTCDGCVGAITRALRAADGGAEVRIDLDAHIVDVTSRLPREALASALEAAGYTAQTAG
jgi:copper chaperone